MVNLLFDYPGCHNWEVWRLACGSPPDRIRVARSGSSRHAYEHARADGVDRPQYRVGSASHLADALRHDGINGVGDYDDNLSGIAFTYKTDRPKTGRLRSTCREGKLTDGS